MINRFLFSAAIDSIGKGVQKPTVDYQRCSNRLQKKQECTACREVCPTGAVSYQKQITIDAEKCGKCYLCSGVCPTGCITTNGSFIKSNDTTDTVVISCEDGENRFKVPCLASLPWEFYAYLSYKTPICMDTRDCGKCQVKAKPNIDAVDERLKIFWGNEYKQKILQDPSAVQQGLSRREFFGIFSKTLKDVKKSIDEISIKDVEKEKGMSVFRKLLVKELAPDKAYNWLVPSITEACWGCSVCEKLCPNNAIKIKQNEMHIDALYCSGCGLCKLTCLDQAVAGLATRSASKVDSVVTSPVNAKQCESCGTNMKPSMEGEICGMCKKRNLKSGKS